MPKNFPRSTRVAEQIRRELAELIQLELKDPRIGMVTLTDVEVTPDYAHAKVFYTMLGDGAALDAAQAGLTHAAGFLRSALHTRMRLRVTPQLQFVYDASVERGARLSQLIDAAIKSDSDRH